MVTFGSLAKPTRLRDDLFLEFVRGRACASCGAPAPNDPNHLRTRGAGGSDHHAVSQCRQCHTMWHQLGPASFADKTGVNLFRANAEALSEFFSDPAVILGRAGDIVSDASIEMTPAMHTQLLRLLDGLEKRAAATEV